MTKISVKFRASKEEFTAAMRRAHDDEATLFQFLLGARDAGAVFNGRSANAAIDAACARLRIETEKQKRFEVRK